MEANQKLDHKTYYEKTIAAIRQGIVALKEKDKQKEQQKEKDKHVENSHIVVSQLITQLGAEQSDDASTELLKLVNEIWSSQFWPITNASKCSGDKPVYKMTFARQGTENLKKSFTLDIKGLLSQTSFRTAFAEVSDEFPHSVSRSEWDIVGRALVALAGHNLIDRGTEATASGRMNIWLDAYLENKLLDELSKHVFSAERAWKSEGEIFLNSTFFLRFIHSEFEKTVTRADLVHLLRQNGFEPHGKIKVPDTRRTLSCWSKQNVSPI